MNWKIVWERGCSNDQRRKRGRISPVAIWEKNGSIDGREKARRIAKDILANHSPTLIDQALVKCLKAENPELVID